ncbi:MAG: glycosyltransferase family 4 protein [Cytophagaceae bacterium]
MAFTGGFKALLDFCIFSKEQIDPVVVLKKGSSNKAVLESHGIKVYELPLIELSKNPVHLFLYFPYLLINTFRLRRIIFNEKIQVLHSNDLYNMLLQFSKFLFRLKIPLIVHVRMMPASFPSFFYNTWRSINTRAADRLIAVSHAIKKAYGSPANMDVVFDVKNIPENHPAYQFSFDGKRDFRFIYLANYIQGKGQDRALKAFEILVKKNPRVCITFAGGDMGIEKNMIFKKQLIERAHKVGLNDKIFFEGFVADVEMKLKMYDASLIFSESESFSLVAYESLRYGIPLIATNCGGPAELFVHGESGFLVSNTSVQEMADTMHLLSSDMETGKKTSINARRHAVELTKRELNYEDLENIFLGMCE